MTKNKGFNRALLRASTALCALMFAGVAQAQDASTTASAEPETGQATSNAPDAGAEAPAVPVTNTNEGAETEEIVVTGSLFRRTTSETASPVTVLSSESLARRGITNVADAVRSISADSSGSIPTAFTGGFGQGSAAVSLRGLTVNSTLTVLDGLRTVTYPLADDGQRAFVDLNTIPRVAIDRIEVLKDGASSTYGADAIGGVVNILMRKRFTGVSATAEAGVTDRGDGGMYRGSFLGGIGDFEEQGWNVYVGAEYERNGEILTADRGFPYDTNDLNSIGGVNLNQNFLVSGGIGTAAVVRPGVQNVAGNPFSGTSVPGGQVRLLNPAQCAAVGTIYDDGHDNTSCEENLTARYGTIQPQQTRWGVTGRASARIGDDAEAYLTASYYQSDVFSGSAPSSIRSATPGPQYQNVVLPVFVCSSGTNCDTAADRSLNPNNPFAANGQAARIYYRFGDIEGSRSTESRVLRGAAGISGSFGEGWTYQVDLTGVSSKLDVINEGLINIAGLRRAINTGSYNFVNPELNSAAVRASLSPSVVTRAKSELYLAQAIVTKELAQLPGGPLQLGVGGQIRREILDQPNQNANAETLALNTYNASGKRTVSAGFFEISAPVLDSLELQASGRYDHYSTGFSRFSPKVGVKFTPIPQLALRGTYSQGFRAPSFAESSGEVIGYTTHQPPCSFRLQHGATGNATSCSGGSPYVSSYAIGYNSTANEDLEPEKSRNFTVGAAAAALAKLHGRLFRHQEDGRDHRRPALRRGARRLLCRARTAGRIHHSVRQSGSALPERAAAARHRQRSIRECVAAAHQRPRLQCARAAEAVRERALLEPDRGDHDPRLQIQAGPGFGDGEPRRHARPLHHLIGRGHAALAGQLVQQPGSRTRHADRHGQLCQRLQVGRRGSERGGREHMCRRALHARFLPHRFIRHRRSRWQLRGQRPVHFLLQRHQPVGRRRADQPGQLCCRELQPDLHAARRGRTGVPVGRECQVLTLLLLRTGEGGLARGRPFAFATVPGGGVLGL